MTVRVRFPWHPRPLCRIKIEVTHDEPVLLVPDRRPILHGYDEALDAEIRCYRLEEIVAEKLRALLQTQEKLATRGWSRPRARDYYDLWRVLTDWGDRLDSMLVPPILLRKCAHRGVAFTKADDFFPTALIGEARAHWHSSLGVFVADLPPCDDVLARLRTLVPRYLPGSPD